jgi:pyrroline-5-carboxylate reductase
MKLGIIGAGNMGLSLVRGLLKTDAVPPDGILISDLDEKKLEEARKLGVKTTKDNSMLARESDVILIAVKPDAVEGVLKELGNVLRDKLLLSVAAGISTSFIEGRADTRTIRIMPNLCAAVGEMAGCYSPGRRATPADEKLAVKIFGKLGAFYKIDESLMDVVTGLSGSGPAFFLRLIRAGAEAGEELGLPEGLSTSLAAQTAKGAGAMVVAGEDPEVLIQKICTPRGTTVEGMKILDEKGAPEVFKDAVKAAARRARELSR